MADKNSKREQIRVVLDSYTNIIDDDEAKEYFHLFMDLCEVMEVA